MRKQILVASLLIFASSCALKPQTVVLNPVSIKPASAKLTEKKIHITTKDTRPMPQVLGVRHKQNLKFQIPFMKPQEIPYINNNQKVADVITKIAEEYLVGDGFVVNENGISLELSLAVLKYETLEKQWYQMPRSKIQLFFTSQVKNESGVVVFNGRHEYAVENTYPLFQPRAKKNEQVINEALSQGMKQIFTDHSLLDALKAEPVKAEHSQAETATDTVKLM